jgi:hypothetical protein
MNEKKPAFFMSVSTGWAIRNFFQTGIIDRLKEHFDVVVLATKTDAAGLAKLGYNQGITVLPIECGKEPLIWRLLRQLKKKIYMEGRASSTEVIWEKYKPRPFYQRIGGKVVKFLIRLCNARRLYNWLEWLDCKINTHRELAGLYAEHQPVLYFATHATLYFEECLVRNAWSANVPAVFMILSWDHLSSKILLHQNFHAILVWNNHTKREILQTYPTYREDQIKVVGIPQYDLYALKPGQTYAEWCKKYGLDASRRTILFSSMPQQRHDQQHIIVEELLKAIMDGTQVPGDFQVLIKCHPFDNFPGYDQLLNKYPVGIHRSTLAPGQEFENWMPTQTEMDSSRDCLYFCTLNINIFSTVTIEAAYFDKPIIHIAFDPVPPTNRIPCHEYYNWDHFKHIVDKNATLLVHSYDELFAAVRQYSTQPSLREAERKLVVNTYVGRKIGDASRAVACELVSLAQAVTVPKVGG